MFVDAERKVFAPLEQGRALFDYPLAGSAEEPESFDSGFPG